MKIFFYSAKSQKGRNITGSLAAPDKRSLIDTLKRRNLIITSIKEESADGSFFSFLYSRVKRADILIFTIQLSIAMEAGIPLLKALEIISRDMGSGGLRALVTGIHDNIERGSTFSESIEKSPDIFPRLYQSLIRVGEQTGDLEGALSNISSYMEAEERIRGKVMNALYYPALVILFSIAIVYAIISIVVPKFKEFYSTFGGDLPLPTKIFLNVSDFISENILTIIIVVAVILYCLIGFLKTRAGNIFIDALKLRIFFFKDLFLKSSISRFANSLAIMYSSGVPIVDALEIAAETTENLLIEETIKKTAARVREGENIVEPLRESGLFTNIAISMIATGLESGKLETMLKKLGNYYMLEVEARVNALISIIEPVMMIVIGAIIGTTLIILALPIIKFQNIIS